MQKYLCQLSTIILFTFYSVNTYCQDYLIEKIPKSKDFSNEYLLDGKKGNLYIINSKDSLVDVIVRWSNGYFAIGKLQDIIPFGKWFVFDKKNRCREEILYGPEAKCIVHSKKIDKKGAISSEFKSITGCF